MEEGKNHNSIQQQAILEHVRDQALANYQIGLREEINTLVRSQHFRTLQEAIAGASSEEKIKGLNDRHRAYQRDKKTDSNYYSSRNLRNPAPQCGKCGKTGHIGQNCRTSRYANKFSLPRAEKPAGINTVEKFCTYCKKAGHNREECWILNGRPDKNTRPRAKREMENKTKRVNSAIKVRNQRSKRNSDSEEASSTSSEEEEGTKTRRTRPAIEHQITQVTGHHANSGLRLITLPINEIKKGRINLLLDTGATLTLIKVGNLKGATPITEKPLTHRSDGPSNKNHRKNKGNRIDRRQRNKTHRVHREGRLPYRLCRNTGYGFPAKA
ncbi:hypothetical protein ALC62_04625 [Cyphomyrmex costatus]|uniref:CCHC-type domain-containing protein n=1 Tax=Cyphomyrmex costatus TaxID=456900 RepID=A0A151IK06_9HYME|nr:hypothetical protein ALC62_04625 [Cyphomyrmex costatus]